MLERILDQANRAMDSAILWQLGTMPVPPTDRSDFPAVDREEFWRASRIKRPSAVELVRPRNPRMNGRIDIVDVEAPSDGPGTHPGSRKLIARAYLQHDNPEAPFVVVLHGFAVPVSWYEQGQCRALNQRGASAVRLDHPWHLRRRSRGLRSGEGYMTGDPGRLLASARQSAEDAAALVAWGRTMSKHVAVVGVSLGGLTACLLAAHVELDAMVAVAPFCNPPATFMERLPMGARRRLGLAGDTFGAWGGSAEDARAVLDAALAPLVVRNHTTPATPADRITLVRPANDLIVGPESITDLADAWGAEMWDMRHSHISILQARGLHARVYDSLLKPPVSAPAGVSLAG